MPRRSSRTSSTVHPTKARLIDVTVELLDEHNFVDLPLEAVLQRAELTKGAVYHHFVDFHSLLAAALAARFARFVDADVAVLEGALAQSTSRAQFVGYLLALTEQSQAPERRRLRLQRAEVIVLTRSDPELAELVAAEQLRLTSSIAAVVTAAQERGWMRPELDPMAVAVFIQAYTLGRLVDDVAAEHVAPGAWRDLIQQQAAAMFVPDSIDT